MHFWIDKRSQCAYSGRQRLESTLSTGVGRRKGMVTPVHRYPPIVAPRRHRRASSQRDFAPAGGVGRAAASAARRPPALPRGSGGSSGSSGAVEDRIAQVAAARSLTPAALLRRAALGLREAAPGSPGAPPLKLGMWLSFAVAIVFLLGAKFYFDNQLAGGTGAGAGAGGGGGAGVRGSPGEARLVWGAAAALLGCVCAVAACRRAPPPPLSPQRVSSTARRPPPLRSPLHSPLRSPLHSPAAPYALTLPLHDQESPGDSGLGSGLTSVLVETSPSVESEGRESPPPPPYHIAVLLPSPPPAYHALS